MRFAIPFVAAMLAAVPASATITIATYTGHLAGFSYDLTGVFGMASQSLDGLAYTATYRIDDSLPGAPVYVGMQGPYRNISSIFGGTGNGTTAVPVTATIKINGITASIAGTDNGFVLQTHGNFDQSYHYVGEGCGPRGCGSSYLSELATLFEPGEFLTSQDFRTPLDVDLTPFKRGDAGGGLSIYRPGATGFEWAYGELRADRLTVSSGSAVPEPTAWALLMAGFGIVGAALRRQAVTTLKGAC